MARVTEISPGEWSFDNESSAEAINEIFWAASESLESGDIDEAMEGFRGVLAANPRHIYALHHLSIAHERLGNNAEARALASAAVQHGLAALPAEFSWNTARLQWVDTDNRPFMRAYSNEARWLEREGESRAAEAIYARLVSVCPDDNLSVRSLLMRSFLRRSDWVSAVRLADQYPDDTTADILYSSPLAHFELHQTDRATKALQTAISCKPKIALELLKSEHEEPPPSVIPGTITMGGEDEAYFYWQENGEYWKRNGDLLLLLNKLATKK